VRTVRIAAPARTGARIGDTGIDQGLVALGRSLR